MDTTTAIKYLCAALLSLAEAVDKATVRDPGPTGQEARACAQEAREAAQKVRSEFP
jgi:hypothetical protein